MRRKLHLKQKKNKLFLSKHNLIIIVIILIFIGIISVFWIMNNKLTPVIMDYAEIQAGRIATLVINQAITKEVTNEMDMDDLFIITKGENDKIKSIDFNPLTINKMLSMVTSNVQLYLQNLENGNIEEIGLSNIGLGNYDKDKLQDGIIFEVPTGIVFNNSLLYNIGPKVPVRLSLIGDIVSNVETEVTNYGINNALIEIIIKISVVEQVILPFASDKITVSTNVPVAIKLIQGEVPNYYLQGDTTGTNVLTVPVK